MTIETIISASASPADRADFAVTSRLLACLVTESLLKAFYVPIGSVEAVGVCVILSTRTYSYNPRYERSYGAADILAIIPLRHTPVLKDSQMQKHGWPVGLVDPLDMLPVVYEFRELGDKVKPLNRLQQAILCSLVPPPWNPGDHHSLVTVSDPLYFWNKFAESVVMDYRLRATIAEELLSSREWQKFSYLHPPVCPSIDAPAISWEQSIVEGHPTHPMHRARRTLGLMPAIRPGSYDYYHPRIRIASIRRCDLTIKGNFEDLMLPLVEAASKNAGEPLPYDDERVLMPVHELQIPNIAGMYPDAEILASNFAVDADGQASIRTVTSSVLPGLALKLAVGMKISSALRTISHFTADIGPRFSEEIIPKLSIDHSILVVETEVASAVACGVDPDVAKHLTAVLRQPYQHPDENVIVCAALLEMGHANVPKGVSAVQHILNLNTDDKRYNFLDRYVRLVFEALLPPVMINGLSFEAHPQNTLARFDTKTGELVGFVIRDLGGIRVHPPTLIQSTGVNFEFLPEHCIVTETVEEAYKKLYHTLIHNHLQRLIRVLGLHYDGRGWEIVRKHFTDIVPEEHSLRHAWLGPESKTVAGKCLLRMKIQDVYRDSVYSPVPNMVHYRPASGSFL